MPYIIATYPEPTMAPGFVGTRRAVATLDEANEALYAIVKERYDSCRVGVPEAGGTVGPLPDGTLITVKRVSWLELARGVGLDCGELCAVPNAEILGAYNAER